MKVLQIISAHAEAQEVFDRHVPIWANNEAETLVYCPAESVVKTHLPVISFGAKGHHGDAVLYRYLWLMRFMARLDYDTFVIQEYDSFCLNREIMTPPHYFGIGANVFKASNPQPPFKGNSYLHYPLVIQCGIIKQVVHAMECSGSTEGGFFDRALGFCCQTMGLSVFDWGEYGWSENTIVDGSVIPQRAVMIHGVKTKEVYDAILEKRKISCAS